ncbi:phage terminase small subunit P27 family [Phycisphaerales bacterium AB-hyl4]|uniref:Phage terminase small subunit P27 family n=1 Tax=Natronomicrosphaera hydrolytica TaxID=3242702 RepID=A0ABV4U1V0_9BACT
MNEPDFPEGLGEVPDWLDDEAKRKWFELAPGLIEVGIAKAVDRDLFASLCQTYSNLSRWYEQVRVDGDIVESHRGTKSHPIYVLINQAEDRARKIEAQFGIGASNRSRIHVSPKADTSDNWWMR